MAASILIFLLGCVFAHGHRVNTTEGVVEGYHPADGNYTVFYGVPYAGPTDGANRYKAPVPPEPYKGIFIANNSNVICAQPTDNGMVGVENCLVLNIFTNDFRTAKPVIVWLNAEDYTNTSPQQFSPKRLVEENVVFVSINFRLSIFGFLCLGVKEAPGNSGLRDVIQGLRWINKNIANFGGDPNNVILMGHASGAAMVDLLTITPPTRGLVHKAIALSGSVLAPWAVSPDPVRYANILGAKTGFTGHSREDLAKHIVKTNMTLIQSVLIESLHYKNSTPLFAPCVEEPNLNMNDTLLWKPPIDFLRDGNFLQIPYIAGYTTKEGTMRASEAVSRKWLEAMNASFSDFLPVDVRKNIYLESNAEDMAYFIKMFYFDFHPVNMSSIINYLDYLGDVLVVMPVIRGIKERSKTSKAEVRLMEFGHLGSNPDVIYNQTLLNGVPHGGILKYLFDYDQLRNDDAMKQSIVKRFVTFAYTGSPNEVNSTIYAPWPAATQDQVYYLSYTSNPIARQTAVAMSDPYHRRVLFWQGIFEMHYMPPRSVFYSDLLLFHDNVLPSSAGKILSSVCFVMLCQFLMGLF